MRSLPISNLLSDFRIQIASWGDLRLLALSLAIWSGVLLSNGIGFLLSFVALVLISLGTLFIRVVRVEQSRIVLLLLSMAFVGGALLHFRALPLESLTPFIGKNVSVEVVVTGDSVARSQRFGSVIAPSFRTPARLEVLRYEGSEIRLRIPVSVMTSRGDFIPSARISFDARVIAPRGPIAGTLIAQGKVRLLGEPTHLQNSAMTVRWGMKKAVAHLPTDAGALLPGLVLGDTSEVDPALSADMKTTGLTHLTAVSGANLAILSSLILLLMKWVRSPRWLTIMVVGFFLAFFVVLVRPQPSVLRAGVMAVVMLIAYGRGVKRAALPALAAAIFFLLLIDPWQGLTYGFALSVAATAGLLLIAPPLAANFARRMPHWLAHTLALPIAAQIMCAPIILALSGNLSIMGVIANCVAAPLVAPATVLGLLAALLSIISLPLASFIAWLAAIPTGGISWIAHHFAALPFASLPWGSSAIAITLFVLLLMLFALFFRFQTKIALITTATIFALLVATSLVPNGWPPREWVMVMCNVGQGDALVLNGGGGKYVVVDAGPDPLAIDRCLNDLGVRHISLLILTHDHADHVEGIPGVLQGREVEAIWLSPLDEPAYEFDRVSRWASGISLMRAPVGETFKVGALQISPLWPRRVMSESAPNNSSVAMLITVAGLRLFLAADMEAPAQEELLSYLLSHREIPASNVDVLKVAHHGSANQSPLLNAYLNPQFALISVGARNPYHHPAPLTLQLLARAQIFRTDRDGSVAVIHPLAVVKPRRTIWRRAG